MLLCCPKFIGLTIYIWGDPETIPDEDIELTCRVHDECNGSDVFGRYVKYVLKILGKARYCCRQIY